MAKKKGLMHKFRSKKSEKEKEEKIKEIKDSVEKTKIPEEKTEKTDSEIKDSLEKTKSPVEKTEKIGSEIKDSLEKTKSPEEKTKNIDSEIKHGLDKVKHFKSGKKEILDSYEIEIDKAKVKIEIEQSLTAKVYNLYVPEIGVATKSLLEEIRNELVSATTVGMKEITDPSAFGRIKKRFMEDASSLIKEKLPHIDIPMKDFLVGKLIQEMLGLGEIEFLINDPLLEEVVIPSAKEPIRVYHKKFGWLRSNINILKEDDIVNYSNIIARRVGRQINVLAPLLDAHLVSGDRVNAILYPISTKGNTITIRKFARDPYTMIDLINNKTINIEVAVLLWLATEYEMNILISGGTASGKTVILNACMPFIPPNHRVISVEDTRELMLPDFLYWTPLVTRIANPEGKGEVSMLDLMVNSLRMRPDRIILGEMRRKAEATVLFEAMHTGHSVFSTLHADSAAETIARLVNPPLSVPANLLKAVNLNVVMFRDRRKGVRRTIQVAEFEEFQGGIRANILYRWIPEGDKIIKHAESSTLYETLARNTGRSQAQIEGDLDKKKLILEWLMKNEIRDLESFGKVTNLYYSNQELLLKSIKDNNLKKLLDL